MKGVNKLGNWSGRGSIVRTLRLTRRLTRILRLKTHRFDSYKSFFLWFLQTFFVFVFFSFLEREALNSNDRSWPCTSMRRRAPEEFPSKGWAFQKALGLLFLDLESIFHESQISFVDLGFSFLILGFCFVYLRLDLDHGFVIGCLRVCGGVCWLKMVSVEFNLCLWGARSVFLSFVFFDRVSREVLVLSLVV